MVDAGLSRVTRAVSLPAAILAIIFNPRVKKVLKVGGIRLFLLILTGFVEVPGSNQDKLSNACRN
jgi:hypothetical protein